MCVGAGLAVLLLNVLFRFGAKGDEEREAEDDGARVLHPPRPLARRAALGARPGRASRARCERQACSVWRSGRPWKARSSACAGSGASASCDTRLLALLAREQVEHGAAEQQRVAARRAGRSAPGRRACAAPPRGGCGESGRRRTARRPRAATGPPRGGAAATAPALGRQQALGEQRGGGEHEQLERALDVGRARGQHARREHVQLAVRHSADDVAARRRSGPRALQRQPRLGGVELRAGGVEDDRELADLGRRAGAAAAGGRTRAGRARARRPPRHARRGAPRRSRRRSRARPCPAIVAAAATSGDHASERASTATTQLRAAAVRQRTPSASAARAVMAHRRRGPRLAVPPVRR